MEEGRTECGGGVNTDEQGGDEVLPRVRPAAEFVYAELRVRLDGCLNFPENQA